MSDEQKAPEAEATTGAAAAGGTDAAKEHAQAQEAENGAKEGEAKGTQAFEPQPGGGRQDAEAAVDTETGAAPVEGSDTPGTGGDQPTGGDDTTTEQGDQSVTGPREAYKVLQGVEFPRGTAHEAGAVLQLTADEAATFAPGLIEKVE